MWTLRQLPVSTISIRCDTIRYTSAISVRSFTVDEGAGSSCRGFQQSSTRAAGTQEADDPRGTARDGGAGDGDPTRRTVQRAAAADGRTSSGPRRRVRRRVDSSPRGTRRAAGKSERADGDGNQTQGESSEQRSQRWVRSPSRLRFDVRTAPDTGRRWRHADCKYAGRGSTDISNKHQVVYTRVFRCLCISQGSVATRFMCGGNLVISYLQECTRETFFWKSANKSWNYGMLRIYDLSKCILLAQFTYTTAVLQYS